MATATPASSASTLPVWIAFGILICLALALPSFPQDPNYHRFAREKTLFGVPNFWNVISNVPFFVVAICAWMDQRRKRGALSEAFRAGVFLTAFGSAYYHWEPNDGRLFWDRLPMTIAFSGVIAALIAKRISPDLGRRILWPLVALNAASVVYWRWSGNLTPYGMVQFGTVAMILGSLLLDRRRDATQGFMWLALISYVAAKLLEGFDPHVGSLLKTMGGHPIKHAAAALGCWWLHRALFTADDKAVAH